MINAVLQMLRSMFGPSAKTPVQAIEQPEKVEIKDSLLALLVNKVIPYMISRGDSIDYLGDNIVFVSGYLVDGVKNDNRIDRFNDVCIVFTPSKDDPSGWMIRHRATCTTSPGLIPTQSGLSLKRGGVAHIKPGQYKAWRLGFHRPSKYGNSHPALVQVAPITIYRDFDQDGKPDMAKEYTGLFGINIHSTNVRYTNYRVGSFSEGCAVHRYWGHYISRFIPICREMSRKRDIFAVSFINGTDL